MGTFFEVIIAVATSGGILLWLSKMLLEKTIDQKLQAEKEKINLIRHHDLEYRRSQIQFLYGPLYGILKTNRKIYDLWMAGNLSDINLKIKQLFKNNNEKANKIIIENAHLVEENPMPEIFIQYATSSQVWSMYCADNEHGSLPEAISQHPDIRWCQKFEDYIFEKYEKLSKELNDLYGRYSIK